MFFLRFYFSLALSVTLSIEEKYNGKAEFSKFTNAKISGSFLVEPNQRL